ncbi:MAG: DUF2961 domain-containing protein [Chloroflexi bacterium]|nr:DUF2961 domain-containing protein [Chloroflexota bacterium]
MLSRSRFRRISIPRIADQPLRFGVLLALLGVVILAACAKPPSSESQIPASPLVPDASDERLVLFDDFSQGNGLLHGQAPSRYLQSDTWRPMQGEWEVKDGGVVEVSGVDGDSRIVIEAGGADRWIQADVVRQSGKVGITFRYEDELNWFMAWSDGEDLILARQVDGKFQELKRTDYPWRGQKNPRNMVVLDEADIVQVGVNGRIILEAIDDSLSGARGVGLFNRDSSENRFDNFIVWDGSPRQNIDATTGPPETLEQATSNGRLPSGLAAFRYEGPRSQLIARFAGRELKSQAFERANLPAGGEIDLLRVDGGGGRIVALNVILGSLAISSESLESSRITIFVDGATDAAVDSELVDFFFTRGLPAGEGLANSWQSDFVGVTNYLVLRDAERPDGRIGYYRFVDIPFEQSVVVRLRNGDESNAADIFGQVEYLSGPPYTEGEPRFSFAERHIEARRIEAGNAVELLTVPEGEGFVDAIYLAVQADPLSSFRWVEMNVVARFGDDDRPGFDSSGTEDFFLSSWGWSSGSYARRYQGHPVHRENGWNAQYRYFPTGLWFRDGIRLSWEPGPTDAAEVGSGDPIKLWAAVSYYTIPNE